MFWFFFRFWTGLIFCLILVWVKKLGPNNVSKLIVNIPIILNPDFCRFWTSFILCLISNKQKNKNKKALFYVFIFCRSCTGLISKEKKKKCHNLCSLFFKRFWTGLIFCLILVWVKKLGPNNVSKLIVNIPIILNTKQKTQFISWFL